MMSSEDGGGRKTASSARQGGEKCPRCDSPNTKFCYYNNYSLTQPRHFCKSCRRYWTKGGALRSVPIGGGCRKNKKVKPSSRLSSSMDCKESGGGSFFHQSCMALPLPLPLPHHSQYLSSGIQGMSSNFNSMNLASSIESLSCINQDLHWKLQQQRLAMLFGGDSSRHNDAVSGVDLQRQPLLFQNLEISNPNSKVESSECEAQEMCGVNVGVGGNSRAALLPTEWFFGASSSSNYASTSSLTPTPPTAAPPANGNHNGSITNNWTTSLHAWDDVHHQYTALP